MPHYEPTDYPEKPTRCWTPIPESPDDTDRRDNCPLEPGHDGFCHRHDWRWRDTFNHCGWSCELCGESRDTRPPEHGAGCTPNPDYDHERCVEHGHPVEVTVHAHVWKRWDSMGDYGYQCMGCPANRDTFPLQGEKDTATLVRTGECTGCGIAWPHSTLPAPCCDACEHLSEEILTVDKRTWSPSPKYLRGMAPDLQVFTVDAEGLAAEYDVYDEWCVLASSEEQAKELVRAHKTYSEFGEPLVVRLCEPVQAGVAYASFHPG